MKQIKKLLAPNDLAPGAAEATRFALELAQGCGAEVIIYYVISPDDPDFPVHHGVEQWLASDESRVPIQNLIRKRKDELHQYLRQNFFDALSGLRVREEVEIGVPDQKIIEKATAEKVDMIVISRHGKSGIRDLLIGSVAEKVLRAAASPVLSIPASAEDSSKG